MPSDFKVYSGGTIEHVGVPIVVVTTVQPDGTNAFRVEWYLFIRSHVDAMIRQGGGNFAMTTQAAALADPTESAIGFSKNAFMTHQAHLQDTTGQPENPQEIEFEEINRNVFNKLWFHDAGREEIASVKDLAKCAPFRHFLFTVCPRGQT